MPVLYAIARYLGFGGCVALGFLVYYEGVPGAAKLQLPDNWHVVGGFGLADVPLVGDLAVGRVEAYSAEQVRIAKATMVSAYEYGALEAQLNKERDLRLKGAHRPSKSIASAPTPLSAPNNQTMTTWNRRSRTMKRNWLTLTAAALLPIFVSGCSPSDRMNAAAEIKGKAHANVPLPDYPADCRKKEAHASLPDNGELASAHKRERGALDRQNARTGRCADFYDNLQTKFGMR